MSMVREIFFRMQAEVHVRCYRWGGGRFRTGAVTWKQVPDLFCTLGVDETRTLFPHLYRTDFNPRSLSEFEFGVAFCNGNSIIKVLCEDVIITDDHFPGFVERPFLPLPF